MLVAMSLQCVPVLSKYFTEHHYVAFICQLYLNKTEKIKTTPKHILYVNSSCNTGDI